MKQVWADAGYTGKLGIDLRKNLGWTLEIVKHPWSGSTGTWVPIDGPEGFVVLRRRWVVERTFSWFGKRGEWVEMTKRRQKRPRIWSTKQ